MKTFTEEQLLKAVMYAQEFQQGADYQKVAAIEELFKLDLASKVLDELTPNKIDYIKIEHIEQEL